MPTKKAKKTTKKTTAKKAVRPNASKSKNPGGQVKKAAKKSAKKPAAKKATKTVRKTAAKKTAVKKSEGQKMLKKARGAACFWTRDGLILENLVTLSNALKSMPDEEFHYHVTRDRNDFADWVEQILEDADCAAALRKSRKPNTAAIVVERHLRYYKI